MRKFLAAAAIILLLAPSLPAAAYSSAAAEAFLTAHNTSPWTVMGLAALGADSINADHLKNISPSAAIDLEAPILAITGLGQNPRTFGATDYVAKLKSFHANGQIGDPNALNDDIFGILALVSAGEPATDAAISEAKSFILSHQNADGGWGYATSAASDTNTTAAAVLALLAAGLPVSDPAIQNASGYLQNAQNADGGFPYDPQSASSFASDSSSTAWVMWAQNALAANWNKNNHSAADFLSAAQTGQGYFEYQPGAGEDAFTPVATAYAAIAFSGKKLPLKTLSAPSAATFDFRIEGAGSQICSGKTAGPTALDIVKNAAGQCNYPYHLTQTSFGPYLDQIDDDKAAGMTGWLYLVNYSSPSIGAGDYFLREGDSVLWYYGDWGWKPTRLSLTPTEAASGSPITATVEFFDDNNWQPLSGARLRIGAGSAATDETGEAKLTAADGYYEITAEKTGYIRSNSVLLKIGNPTAGTVNLGVTVDAGSVLGATTTPDTIAFSVQPGQLDFGTLKPGGGAEKSVTVTNTGGKAIHLETVVAGDSLFTNALLVEGVTWRRFSANLNSNAARDYSLKLTVPADYSQSGSKSGQITFWAMATD